MANPNGRRGAVFESRVADYLNENCTFAIEGHPEIKVERRRTNGVRDRGDLANVGAWCLELKNTKTIDLAAAIDEAKTEQRHTGSPYAAAIINRRAHPIGRAYVVMQLDQFCEIARILEHARKSD